MSVYQKLCAVIMFGISIVCLLDILTFDKHNAKTIISMQMCESKA